LPDVRYGTDPADALDIAASLRALAVVISGMAAYLRQVSVWRQDQVSGEAGGSANPLHRLDAVMRRLRGGAFRPVEILDTS